MRIVGKNQQAKVGDMCQNDEFTVTISVSREEFDLLPMYRSAHIVLSEEHQPKAPQEYPSEAQGYDKIPLDGGPNAWPYERVNIEGEGHLYKPDWLVKAQESPVSESMTFPAGITVKDGVVQVGPPPPAYHKDEVQSTKPTPGKHVNWKPQVTEE